MQFKVGDRVKGTDGVQGGYTGTIIEVIWLTKDQIKQVKKL